MSPNRRRRVRVDQFKQQLAEEVIGADSLVDLEIGEGRAVTIYVPIDADEAKELAEQLKDAGEDKDAGALAVFSHNPDRRPEDQLADWLEAGLTVNELIRIFMTETRAAQERLGNFRYRG